MRKYYAVWYAGIAIVLVFAACQSKGGEPKDREKSAITMAEDSQLALLMRQMTEETDSIRAAVQSGKSHPLWSQIKELHTATPTDSASSGPVFEGFASAFIGAVEEMEASDSANVKYFNAVIDRCMDCHQSFCPGPMKRIRKFYVPASS